MSEQGTFYIHKLYPLQDQVLSLFTNLKSRFYLTGGTAISRFMLNHRYSDDLDFFLNNDKEFTVEAERAISKLGELFNSGINVTYKSSSFYRATINSQDISLKLDFVNDVGFHSGEFLQNDKYHKIDNEKNILSNKLSALQRGAAKDVADILYLSFQYEFNWMDIIEDAKKKDTWVNEIDVATGLNDFSIELLNQVKWVNDPDYPYLKKCLNIIAKDILMAADNSLYK